MVHDHREQPPSRGRGCIPLLSTTLRRTGLLLGCPRPASTATSGMQHPRMVIRLPARMNNRDMPVGPNTAWRRTLEPTPPSYTGQVGPDEVGNLRAEREPEGSDQSSGNSRGDPRMELSAVTRGIQEPNKHDMPWENLVTSPRIAERERRVEPQRVQITLDPEITETIRRIAREQRTLRKEVEGFRRDTLKLRVLAESNESLGSRSRNNSKGRRRENEDGYLSVLQPKRPIIYKREWRTGLNPRDGRDREVRYRVRLWSQRRKRRNPTRMRSRTRGANRSTKRGGSASKRNGDTEGGAEPSRPPQETRFQ